MTFKNSYSYDVFIVTYQRNHLVDQNDFEHESLFARLESELSDVDPESAAKAQILANILEFFEQGVLANLSIRSEDELSFMGEVLQPATLQSKVIDSTDFRFRNSFITQWLSVFMDLPEQSKKIITSAVCFAIENFTLRMFFNGVDLLAGEDFASLDTKAQIAIAELMQGPGMIVETFANISPLAKVRGEKDNKFWEEITDGVEELLANSSDSPQEYHEANPEALQRYHRLATLMTRPGETLFNIQDAFSVLCDIIDASCEMFGDQDTDIELYVKEFLDEFKRFVVDVTIDGGLTDG